jgi:S-adenosylmethionine:tRNA ribosyltransferase-isomerase
MTHARFTDLPRFLRRGDLVVVNDSATLPAALTAGRQDGAEQAFHLSTRLPGGLWIVEPRGGGVSDGEVLSLPAGGRVRLLVPYRGSPRLWIAALQLPGGAVDYLRAWGRPITYSYVRGSWPIEMYQTVYAREPGSAEMPSAGRPFTDDLILTLLASGIGFARVTLHAGVSSLESHEQPHEEWFSVPVETADAVAEARTRGGRIVAVGTTVVRALESALDDQGRVVATRAWTDLIVAPDRPLSAVDALLTGFHEPAATHLWMLNALAGERHLRAAYGAALAGGYLWHEFGDLHLTM